MGLNNLGNLDDLRGGDLKGSNYSSQESSGAPEQQNDDAASLQGEASLSQKTGRPRRTLRPNSEKPPRRPRRSLSPLAASPLICCSTPRRRPRPRPFAQR